MCVVVNKQAKKETEGAMIIKAQTNKKKNKDNKNSNCDKRQVVLQNNTRPYISHKECTT